MICFQFLFFVFLMTTRVIIIPNPNEVVICFQFLFFVFLMTTFCWLTNSLNVLWFAFNFCSLYFWWQQILLLYVVWHSCDLLSIFVLCIFDDNILPLSYRYLLVVICFQFLFFVFLMTTYYRKRLYLCWLWFAFNFCSLYFWWQLIIYFFYVISSCDLLSIFVLCIFDDNRHKHFYDFYMVVICFQFLFFVFLMTTKWIQDKYNR